VAQGVGPALKPPYHKKKKKSKKIGQFFVLFCGGFCFGRSLNSSSNFLRPFCSGYFVDEISQTI
jgi:hypothetical protein